MSSNLPVFNCGSSSLTYKLYRADANRHAPADAAAVVSAAESRVPVLTIPTDEEVVIARAGLRLLAQ